MSPLGSDPPAQGGKRPGRSRSLSLSAGVALGTLLCASSCTAGRAAPRPDAAGSTTVPAPTSTTEPPPQYAPSPYSWTRSASPSLAVGGGAGTTLAAIIAPTLNQPWTAVGTRVSAAGVPAATVWTSRDGITWSGSPVVATGMASSARSAAQYRGQTVVAGSVGAGANRQAAAWISASPGAAFAPVSVPLTGGPSGMSLVAAGALGLFATGTVDGRLAVWSSTDGQHWTEQPEAEKVIGSAAGAQVNALMAEGDTVYAAGSTGSGATQAAAVWATTDGLHWHMVSTAATAFAGAGGRVIYSLAPLGNGLVAGGAINRGTGWVPASWVSPDGASWSPPSTDFPGAPVAGTAPPYGASGGTAVRSVAAVPTFAGSTSLVATGGGPGGQAAWRSTDGLRWTALTLPPGTAGAAGWRATVTAATVDTTVIADGDPGQAHLVTDTPAGWSEPSADPAVFGPVRPTAAPLSLRPAGGQLVMTVRVVADPQAIGAPSVSYTTLASTDGVNWSPAPAGAGDPPTVPAAGALTVQYAGGWVAVAQPVAGQPEGWTSVDGRTWTAQGLLDAGGAAASGSSGTNPTEPLGPSLPATVTGLCTTAPAGSGPPAGAGEPTTSSTNPAGHQPAVVAVGTALQPPTTSASGQAEQGRQAAAWVYTAVTGWRRVTVSPTPSPGGVETVSGCARTPGGFVAWGSTTGGGGASEPAVWRSATGAAWSRVNVNSFSPGAPYPLTDLAVAGSTELAVADPDPAGGPVPAGPNPATGSGQSGPGQGGSGPAGPALTAGAIGPAPSFENGQAALWFSTDGGSSWEAVDTATPPWLGTEGSAAGLVAFAASTPVLAGTVDGQLAVWTGAPAGPAATANGAGAGAGSS